MEERSTTNQLRIPNRKIGFAQKEGSFDLDLRRNPQRILGYASAAFSLLFVQKSAAKCVLGENPLLYRGD